MAFGALVLAGLFLPYVNYGFGGSENNWSGNEASWALLAVGALSIVTGLAARAGHVSAMAFASGLAVAFAGIAAVSLRLLFFLVDIGDMFGDGISLHVGAVAWMVAVVLGLILAFVGIQAASEERDTANPAWVLAAVLGAGVFTWGIIQPPFGGSIWDGLFGADDAVWNVLTAVVIGTVPLFGVLVLAYRSQTALMLLGGAATFWFMFWFTSTQDFTGSSEGFLEFREGQFAANTIGLGLMLGAALLGGLGAPANEPRPATSYRTVQVVGVGIVVLLGLVGVAGQSSEDQFQFRFDDNDFDPGFSTVTGLPYDARLTPLADGCAAGSMSDCNELYWVTPVGSDFEEFGATCGGRRSWSAGNC